MSEYPEPPLSPLDPLPDHERREVLKILAAVAAMPTVFASCRTTNPGGGGKAPVATSDTENVVRARPAGTPTDPDLHTKFVFWNLKLSDEELATAKALCNVILPPDHRSRGAGDIGVQDFVNEWVSAPYPKHEQDLKTIREGLVWLKDASHEAGGARFEALSPEAQTTLCDRICDPGKAAEADQPGARFFARFRSLTLGGFYSTAEGRKDLQWMGNVARTEYPLPPQEVLDHLGLTAEDLA